MKKIFTKIAICFCTICTLLFCGVACAPDNRTAKQKAWDELNSIGTGIFEEGTVGGKYAYKDYNDNATKIEITVNEYENVVITILEGNAAGETVTIGVYGWRETVTSIGCIYFRVDLNVSAYFDELIVYANEFYLE